MAFYLIFGIGLFSPAFSLLCLCTHMRSNVITLRRTASATDPFRATDALPAYLVSPYLF
jgi:hypothetical protein